MPIPPSFGFPKSTSARLACLAIAWIVGWLVVYLNFRGGPDEYLQERLTEINQSLDTPPAAFSMEFVERSELEFLGKPPIRPQTRGHGIFVDADKIQHRTIEFKRDDANAGIGSTEVSVRSGNSPTCDHVQVAYLKNGITFAKRSIREWKSVDTSVAADFPFSVGNPLPRDSIHLSQLLLNPCFTQLRLNVTQLRHWWVKRLPDQGPLRVYEFKNGNSGVLGPAITLTLYFSPQHNHSLTKSILIRQRSNGQYSEVVNTVETWQKLADGRFVPTHYTHRTHSRPNNLHLSVDRRFTSSHIGKIDPAKFDVSQIPEFQIAEEQSPPEPPLPEVSPSP